MLEYQDLNIKRSIFEAPLYQPCFYWGFSKIVFTCQDSAKIVLSVGNTHRMSQLNDSQYIYHRRLKFIYFLTYFVHLATWLEIGEGGYFQSSNSESITTSHTRGN